MKRILLFLSIILVSALVFAAPEPAPPIKGKVLTADGQPAASVTVKVKSNGRTTLTDEDGSFTLSNLPAGDYDLEISLTGFATTTEHVTVHPHRTASLAIRLQVSAQQLLEVVVTGGVNRLARRSSDDLAKMPLKNTENPQVYTTITKELLNDQLVQSVDEGLRNATGLQKMWDATGRSGDGGGYYNARGFILQSQLRNGVAGNVTSKIDAANLERIEVLKGPSATLFGSTLSSYGGLINRVTKKPSDRFGGEVNFTTGNFGYSRVGADINAPLNAEQSVLLRVNTAYTDEGSFQDNGFNRGFVFAPSIAYKASARLSFLFDAEIVRSRNTTPPIFFFPYGQTVASLGVDRADKLLIDYRRSFFSDDLSQQSAVTNLFGQMRYRFNDNWSTQSNVTVTNSYSDGPGPYFYILSNGLISRNDQFTANSRDRMLEIQQNINGDFAIGNLRSRFVAGLDYFNHTPNQLFSGGTYDTIASYGKIPAYRDFNRINLQKMYAAKGVDFYYPIANTSNTYSAYASDVLNLTDNLMVLAALRLDHFVNRGSYDPTTGTTTGGYNQTALSPKFGVVYQPVRDQVSVFANYQNGFTNKTGTDYKGQAFRPEKAWQTEAGVKLDLFGQRLTGTVSVYDIRVENIVRAYIPATPDPSLPAFPQIQDGTQRSKGIEAEVVANPFAGFNVVAGFAYNDSKYEKADKDVEGLRPSTAASPYSANWWLNYKLPAGILKGLGIGFGGNYASDNKIVNSVSQGIFILPAYTVLGTSVFCDHARFRFTLKADNLTDKHYWVGYTTVNPQALRSVKASVAFKF